MVVTMGGNPVKLPLVPRGDPRAGAA